MSAIINEAKAQWILWRLAIVRVCFYSAMSLGSCWMTATNQVDMTNLGTWEWAQTIIGCFVAWSAAMMAFIDKTSSQIAAGQLPLNGKEAETK